MDIQIETGAQTFARELTNRGVKNLFAITGAGNLALLDAIIQTGSINIVYCHHEQAAVMAAQGYSRVSGQVGVAIVTTGGGSTNAVTGVLSAQLDSDAVFIVTGNESSFHITRMEHFRAVGVQGFDSTAVMKPVSKLALRVMDVHLIPDAVAECWDSVLSGRRGPAVLDFPMDLQRAVHSAPNLSSKSASDQPRPTNSEITRPGTLDFDALILELSQATRPLFYFGNGLRGSFACDLARKFVDEYQIPFAVSWSALDLFDDDHPLNIGRVGIYGDRAANIILQKADLFISVGSRLAIPQVGYDRNDFARKAKRYVVDIDPIELTKFDGKTWVCVHDSATDFLQQVLNASQRQSLPKTRFSWRGEINEIRQHLPRLQQCGNLLTDSETVHSVMVVQTLNELVRDDAVIVTDVGAGLLSGHYALEANGSRRIFTSQGLGEMGFGLPGAIGAFFADPNRQIVCLNTDGGIMLNLQELQVVRHHKIPLKLFIFNNAGYSMIRISQQNLFEGRHTGVDELTGVSFPDFKKLAEAFSFDYVKIDSQTHLGRDLRFAMDREGAVLIDVRMSPNQKYLPRLGTTTAPDGSLISPPLEDLEPQIELEELERLLGYRAHKKSYEIRGREYV
jgi:acetolactate synthase-1/2/3 large subunit